MKTKKSRFLIASILCSLFCYTFTFAQCEISLVNGQDVKGKSYKWGQSFTTKCAGALEYVGYVTNGTGTISAGTLHIYAGNTTTETPIYSQAHPAITIKKAGDPLRIKLTETLLLEDNSQYTFEFTVDNYVVLLMDLNGSYTEGSAFQNGHEITYADFNINVSIIKP